MPSRHPMTRAIRAALVEDIGSSPSIRGGSEGTGRRRANAAAARPWPSVSPTPSCPLLVACLPGVGVRAGVQGLRRIRRARLQRGVELVNDRVAVAPAASGAREVLDAVRIVVLRRAEALQRAREQSAARIRNETAAA